MKENQWPYPDIEKAELSARIASVEKILQKYGAVYIEDFCGECRWIGKDGAYLCEKNQRRVWKRGNEYIRVDRMYFPERPFLVLEFSEEIEGPYEDGDPFPFNLSEAALEQEVRDALGIGTEDSSDLPVEHER